jgi:uncharacterized protein YabN with tetrapyrrole methylase and pyrophosphatase domain
MNLHADLFLLGSGIRSFLDVTLSTQKILRECQVVYFLHNIPSLERYLHEIAPRAENLMPIYYLDGRKRSDIYQDIARHVLDGMTQARPVALLLHGHPLVYSDISQLLIAQCGARGLRVEIVPAVSSLDRIFVDLNLDIGKRGVQIFEATLAVRNSIALNPTVDTLLLQVGSLDSPIATRERNARPEEALLLGQYLERFYPRGHVGYFVESSVELGFESCVTPAEIGNLDLAASAMNYTTTLYIPALDPAG